jgi:tetratricopeptide (TPR) repeat protein
MGGILILGKTTKDKLYFKAVRYYEEGEIEKAIKKCEESIASSIKSPLALNLRGLLLYLKGDLEGAINQWKINSDFNDDTMAKNYIYDCKSDIERLAFYKKGEELLKKLDIEGAIVLLKKCKESDFNSIKVNLALAICYGKKGDYSTSSVYVSNVLNIDRNNSGARSLAKDIEEFQGIKLEVTKGNNVNKRAIVIGLLCLVIAGGLIIYGQIDKNKTEKISNSEPIIEIPEAEAEEVTPKSENEKEEIGETKTESLVNYETLKENINNKDFDLIYTSMKKINADNIQGEEKAIYLKGKELLETEGVSFFYKKGSEFYNQKNFKDAKDQFVKGYEYGTKHYLYQHIIFFNAASDENLGNIDSAINGYGEYYNNYKKETYMAETVYKLALLNKDKDINKSILYAREIREEHADSIYNNQVISDLLDKE